MQSAKEQRWRKENISACGYCEECQTDHNLSIGNSREYALRLMKRFRHQHPSVRSALNLSSLFGESRGKMFGVLETVSPNGETRFLYAFSGQLDGKWQLPGWAPPLFDPDQFDRLVVPEEKIIKDMGYQMDRLDPGSKTWIRLRRKRRDTSRALMEKIHNLYRLTNFHNRTVPLREAYRGTGKPPTGTGDCCAPKLLNQAVQLGLKPVGISEFFWGKETLSMNRKHSHFYPSCSEKCEPILGFMLCGLNP